MEVAPPWTCGLYDLFRWDGFELEMMVKDRDLIRFAMGLAELLGETPPQSIFGQD
jgi:hypothetical protein